jgi:glutamate racemase
VSQLFSGLAFFITCKMEFKKDQPIGVFDSGLGGLTVAKAISLLLPNEQLIYFGDTAHLPYGDKSKETIIQYSTRIAEFLIHQHCKVIVIACNSASANAYNEVVSRVGNKAMVLNVIDPIVDFIAETDYRRVGVIGTKSTIDSNTYQEKINAKKNNAVVHSMATPLFVPMIEEGFIFDDISNAIIRNYLSRHEISNIDSLILGCTHYPIVKNQISKFFNFTIDIIDSGKIVAARLQRMLADKNLFNDVPRTSANKFYVSDLTRYFKQIARMFFEEEIDLERLDFWK